MIEKTVLTHLVYNEEYARRTLPFLKTEYFQNPTERLVFDLVDSYVKTYNDLPSKEALVIEPADRSIWVGEAVTSRQGGTLTSVAEMVAATDAPFALDRSSLRLTVLGGARAVQIEGCPAP
jgi:hypothetical protein